MAAFARGSVDGPVIRELMHEEWEELLNLPGWVLEVRSIPILMSQQLREVLRASHADLRWRLVGRRLRWPFSFRVCAAWCFEGRLALRGKDASGIQGLTFFWA